MQAQGVREHPMAKPNRGEYYADGHPWVLEKSAHATWDGWIETHFRLSRVVRCLITIFVYFLSVENCQWLWADCQLDCDKRQSESSLPGRTVIEGVPRPSGLETSYP